jgi:hypothetical protein
MKKFFSNKKGEEVIGLLPTKVVKLVLAVICILILVTLAVKLWFNSSAEQAEASLKLISNEIERLNSGGAENSAGMQIPNPAGWDILSFTENEKPNLCVGEKCICVCDVNFLDNVKSQAGKCDKKGVCEAVTDLVSFDRIAIKTAGATFILIKKTEKGIEIK